MTTPPPGFIRLTNFTPSAGHPTINARHVVHYRRPPGSQHTRVTLISADEDAHDVYAVTETPAEIDALLHEALSGLPRRPVPDLAAIYELDGPASMLDEFDRLGRVERGHGNSLGGIF